jgi:undecaprenyl-diphosphatase
MSRVHRIVGDVDRRFAAIAVGTGVLFVMLTVAVAIHPAPFSFDRPIAVAIQSAHFGLFEPFNSFVSGFAGLVGIGVGLGIIAITFVLRRPATLFVAFSALYAVIYNVVNFIIQRPRPTGLAHTTSHLIGSSFPSGHVAFFVWLGTLAIILLANGLPRLLYVACWVLVVLVVVGAAVSRVDVGAHWPSDVVGGFLVGLGWMSLTLSLGRLTKPILDSRRAATRG